MRLSDILAMQVPSGVLKQVVKNEKLDNDARLSIIEDMANIIADKKPLVGQDIADQFQYAGATAVNIHMVTSNISPEWKNREFFKGFLIEKYSENLFTRGLRPELSDDPKLVRAREVGDKLVLSFSYLGSPRRVYENYEVVIRRQQLLDYVVIHFDPFSIEIRASQSQNETFKRTMLSIMGIEDEVTWDKLTKLTEQQAKQLAKRSNAKLRSAKHKMTEGVYSTKEVTANPQVEDLEAEEDYQKEFNNQPVKKKTLSFKFPYSFGFEDEVSYVITDEGLWFRSNVGEEVISHVFNTILDIKFGRVSEQELLEVVENI